MFTSLQSCSSLLLLLAHCFISWHLTTVFRLVELCETIGRRMYHFIQTLYVCHKQAHTYIINSCVTILGVKNPSGILKEQIEV